MHVCVNQAIEKVDNGYRLPPPPGCPRTIYRMMIKCWYADLLICNFSYLNAACIILYRNPDPRSRPRFGQIMKLLSGHSGYLLRWSDGDKEIAGEDATKLGAPLENACNLYTDLQQTYQTKKLN